MIKKTYVLAIASLILIPLVTMAGVLASTLIDPEIALRTGNYERNYRLLDQLRTVMLLATLILDIGLWFLSCLLLLKSKKRSNWWLLLGVFGPLGWIGLTLVRDKDPLSGDLYQRFVRSMKPGYRVAYELGVFAVVWVGAFLSMVVVSEVRITAESFISGTPKAQIVSQQIAASGMWAFGEGLQVLGLVVLFYLIYPVLFNIAGRLLSLKLQPLT